jgi:hypothetical protein
MLGFLIGTVCLVGLVKTLRWGRCESERACGGYGYGHGGFGRRRWGGGYGAWGGGDYDHDGERGGFGGPGVFLRALFRELSTTPGQEKAIVAAYAEMREATKDARGEVRASRADLAKTMRGPAVDEVLFGEMFARHDAALEKIRRASIGAIAKVHDALDEGQRARFADLIESGPRGFRGGPFRSPPWAAAYPL